MRYIPALLLIITVHFITAKASYAQNEKEWIEKGDSFLDAKKYEDAVAAFINALQLNPQSKSTHSKLLKAEKHVDYSFLINENDVETTGLQYISLFGDRGKYFNQVRHELGMIYKTKAYMHRDKNEVSLMEEVHHRYKMAMGEPSLDIESWISLSAQDSAVKAEENKDWEAAVRYNAIVLSNTRHRRDYEVAKERMSIAQKKAGSGLLSCTASSRQYIYSTAHADVLTSGSAPKLKRRSVIYQTRDTEINVPLTEVILVLDPNDIPPSMLVFNDRGKAFCTSSESSHLLDFPDHFSYRALTKDRKIITAGVAPYARIVPEQAHRKLVNDNINKEPIAEVDTKDLVIEALRYRHQFDDNYEIHIHVQPKELELYRNEIIAWMRKEYLDLENIAEGTVAEGATDSYQTDVIVDNSSENSDLAKESEVVSDTKADNPSNTISAAELASTETVETDNQNLGKRIVPKLEDSISEEERTEIQLRAEEKLKELESSFTKLTNRQLSRAQKQRVRESTVEELFINDRASVSVSSLKSPQIVYHPIPVYLLRLETMISGAYQEVEIEFSEIHKVSNFIKNPDGTWSAVVTFTQKFQGYKDLDGNKLSYSDITHKNVTVKIRRVELFTGDALPDVYWEVLLADIGVNQTEPFND